MGSHLTPANSKPDKKPGSGLASETPSRSSATSSSSAGGLSSNLLEALRSQGGHADTIFQHLDQSNGVASPIVTSFAQDASRFLWIGTQLGVLRWDGYRLRQYSAQLGVAGALPDSYVNALLVDPSGELWVGTNSAGLVRYDATTDKFVRYLPAALAMNHLRVSALASDGAGGLWVGTDGGLDHLDIATGRYDRLDTKAILPFGGGPETGSSGAAMEVQAQRRITTLLKDRANRLWVGTEGGLFVRTSAEQSFAAVHLPTAGDGTVSVLSLDEDSKGGIWVGTTEGVYASYGPPEEAVLHQVVGAGPLNPLEGEAISSIIEARPGTMWFGTTSQGIISFDIKSRATFEILHDIAVPTSLSDDSVAALFRDAAGTVWVATQRGASYTNTIDQGIRTYFGGSSRKDALSDKDVFSVYPMQNGPIWLGTTNGIDLFDQAGKKLKHLSADAKHSETAVPPGAVRGLAQAGDGTVYIAANVGIYHAQTDGTGLREVRLNLKPAPSANALLYQPASEEKTNDALSSPARLWIGSNEGLFLLDLDTRGESSSMVHTLVKPPLASPLSNRRVSAILPGHHNDLWVGTQNGLNHLDLATMAVQQFLPNPADSSSLASGFVSSLLWDQQGRLWVGTQGGGIAVMQGDAPHTTHRIIDQLPSVNVDKMLLGHDGRVWASTDGGIVVIDTHTFALRPLGIQDGAPITGYWVNSGAELENGRMIFGGVGGVTSLDPTMLLPEGGVHPVVITDLVVGGKPAPAEQENKGAARNDLDAKLSADPAAASVAPIVIQPNANSMTAEFSALDYLAPQQDQYQYRLVGFDESWIQTTADRRLASYTNLPPGSYTLEIRASNSAGVWGPTRAIPVRVLPAWNQTVGFWIGVTVLSLLILIGIILGATAYLRRQRRELEKEVARRTAELEQMTVELQQSKQMLERMAYSDSLTGLPNRRMFTEYFRRLLALKRRQKGAFALLMIDLDDFKEVNDTFGHDAGDALLKEVARRLNLLVRESDCFARLGGDEFAMLLAESNQYDGVENVCRKIVESFHEPILFQGIALRTTPSIGVVLYPGNGESQDKLYKMADVALYRVKSEGGNAWQWCAEDPDLTSAGASEPQSML